MAKIKKSQKVRKKGPGNVSRTLDSIQVGKKGLVVNVKENISKQTYRVWNPFRSF